MELLSSGRAPDIRLNHAKDSTPANPERPLPALDSRAVARSGSRLAPLNQACAIPTLQSNEKIAHVKKIHTMIARWPAPSGRRLRETTPAKCHSFSNAPSRARKIPWNKADSNRPLPPAAADR